ncbi:sigma 54-interacting transcriptional regulator [Lutibacter sp. B2]|nr:sigma 54-interacting transcriptional regulator [Lutibacter sp. B2]
MELKNIVSSVQSIAQVIASVIRVEVTIVDANLDRIAATGTYKDDLWGEISQNSVFGFSLKTGESFIIENPRKNKVCLQCENRETCKEYAEVCCPIKIKGQTIGVIGLVALDENQKNELMKNRNNLMEFLNRMADLIATKLLEKETTEKVKILAKELEVVLDSVDKGIIVSNQYGDFLHWNAKAVELFRIDEKHEKTRNVKQIIKHISIEDILKNNIEIKNKEFRYETKEYYVRGVFDAKQIIVEEKKFGVIFTFSNISEILNVVNDITTPSIVTTFDNIIGESDCINKVKIDAQKAAMSNSTVLIQGESGTGKELFARAIHFYGSRAKGPFIPINCAAIPEQLLESELFGYEEGAFTGSKRGGKAGKFELANKGTIFLDEIGDMPLHLQVKLLRVLQEYTVERIGGNKCIPMDVRIIAATNKNLDQRVLEGEFREDLFYRLNVIPIYIPPLRERKEDISILVEKILTKCNGKLGKIVKGFDESTLDIFLRHKWPGNVRELENTIEYAVNMCGYNLISEVDIPNRLKVKKDKVIVETVEGITPIEELEIREIKKALKYYANTQQAISNSAKALGISRATLYRKIKTYHIE